MIIYLHGPDTYRLRQRLLFFREGFKKKYDGHGLNVVTLDGAQLTTEEFRKNVGQVGFLSTKRFIVIENLLSGHKQKNTFEQLADYLENEWSGDNVLVFLEEEEATKAKKKPGTKRVGNPLLAYLLQKAKIEDFPLLSGEQLTRWIGAEVKKRGGQIVTAAARELAMLVGSDLWMMSSEIEKLINYKGGGTISAHDVSQQVRAAFDENIFHLTDALAAKDAQRSFKMLHDQLESGSHELYVLTMLVRQFRILLQVKSILAQEPNSSTVAARLGIHPFVAQKAVRDAQKFTAAELEKIYRQLMEIDAKIKTSQENPRLLFDLLVMEICDTAA